MKVMLRVPMPENWELIIDWPNGVTIPREGDLIDTVHGTYIVKYIQWGVDNEESDWAKKYKDILVLIGLGR